MEYSNKEKIGLFLRHRIPLAATLILMFLFFVPINSLQLSYFRPSIGIICVYYWTVKRGYMFGYFSAFIVGFLMDVYSSSPLGLNIFAMMLLMFMTDWTVRYFQSSFSLSWFLFGILTLGITLFKWLILMVYSEKILVLWEVLVNYCSTLMFYPFVCVINLWVQKRFLPPERMNE